jgi:hypothetical protein
VVTGGVGPDARVGAQTRLPNRSLANDLKTKREIRRIQMKMLTSALSFASLCVLAGVCHAGWYTGNVQGVGATNDGTMVVFQVSSFPRKTCTCFSRWPDYFCLNPARQTSKYEVAMVIAAQKTGGRIAANIDEATCVVQAIEIYPN